MKTKFVLLFMLALALVLSCSDERENYMSLSFEVRLAESSSGPGLTEMTIQNSDLKFFVKDSVFLNNSDITSTDVIDWETHPKVMVRLNDDGREKFKVFTKRNIGKNAAILVGGKLISAPRINAAMTDGRLIIVGFLSHQESQKIANGIRSKK